MPTLTEQSFAKYLPDLNVSRETLEKYKVYFDLLIQWNKAIPLVQEKTIDDFYVRHIIDSLQIYSFLSNKDAIIADIGTGAGFPGMVLSMFGCSNITLVESNRKKISFLGEVARQTNTSVRLLNERAENITSIYEVVLSRACSSLSNLLSLMKNVSRETSAGIFHKGENHLMEIKEAEQLWKFDYSLYPSVTDSKSKIIIVKNLEHK